MLSLDQALEQAQVDPQLVSVVDSITITCKNIAERLRGGALSGLYGSAEQENIQGEVQKNLDVISNDLLKQVLLANRSVAGIASEEEEDVIAGNEEGQYLVTFDPLDGSSNIDVNVTVGTIFSILALPKDCTEVTADTFLQAGNKQIAAGYVLYGPSVILAITTGKGVAMYNLGADGVFYQTQDQVQVPTTTAEFAINISNQRFWQAPMQAYVNDLLLGEEGPLGKRFNMRWIASMVAEVHRILTRGGIFMYPYDSRDPSKAGKLRLMYEGNPMSFLIEQAGGAASNTLQPIMDVEPHHIHQRVPVILGSKEEVERINRYHKA
ncbi:class 1 fructose-bisphosphatase [Oceanospirillaceae bacterium]|jgi:fructose-1,6-bisphosphatase I|uniref:class 1 fructose-bisphosphatase n=1 Tax=Candidatus Njordibacter sp. Uisw_002 TaxID=3230971 RepID=UPI002368FEF2|nr:class 1 fructose-bisphosphatase [Oceanospirillaceae bacterium]MDC1340859.1 class 1 fructose-bisphosphatase [Oceanospirillaceae bacterium]|tara:strand:+ start:7381 stop:8349 length:969 start_codon:yes stop_codon:yes gene_type:complete